MSKKTLTLATKIVEQHATLTPVEANTTTATMGKNGKLDFDNKPQKAYAVELPILGYSLRTFEGTKADAQKEMAKFVAAELDNGNLALSETWAEDNLGS